MSDEKNGSTHFLKQSAGVKKLLYDLHFRCRIERTQNIVKDNRMMMRINCSGKRLSRNPVSTNSFLANYQGADLTSRCFCPPESVIPRLPMTV